MDPVGLGQTLVGVAVLAPVLLEVREGDFRPVAQLDHDRGVGRRLSAALPLVAVRGLRAGCIARSEEHTSELQSLMRISYAVFCLKTKKQQKYKQNMK